MASPSPHIECPDNLQVPPPGAPTGALIIPFYAYIGTGINDVNLYVYDYMATLIWEEPMEVLYDGWYRILLDMTTFVGSYFLIMKVIATGPDAVTLYKPVYIDRTLINAVITSGLTHNNVAVENTFVDANHTKSDFYHYDTPAHATLNDHSTGLLSKWELTIAYDGGKPTVYKMVKTI